VHRWIGSRRWCGRRRTGAGRAASHRARAGTGRSGAAVRPARDRRDAAAVSRPRDDVIARPGRGDSRRIVRRRGHDGQLANVASLAGGDSERVGEHIRAPSLRGRRLWASDGRGVRTHQRRYGRKRDQYEQRGAEAGLHLVRVVVAADCPKRPWLRSDAVRLLRLRLPARREARHGGDVPHGRAANWQRDHHPELPGDARHAPARAQRAYMRSRATRVPRWVPSFK